MIESSSDGASRFDNAEFIMDGPHVRLACASLRPNAPVKTLHRIDDNQPHQPAD